MPMHGIMSAITTAHCAVQLGFDRALRVIGEGNPKILEESIGKDDFISPLSIAMQGGKAKCLQVIVDIVGKAKIAKQIRGPKSTLRGGTLCHMSAQFGHVNVMKVLVDVAGPGILTVQAQNKFGDTPAHCAAETGQVGSLRYIASVAGPRALRARTFNNGMTPAYKAVTGGCLKADTVLRELTATGVDLGEDVAKHEECLRVIFDHCGPQALLEPTHQGFTPAAAAVEGGLFGCLQIIADCCGAEAFLCADHGGTSPAIWAAVKRSTESLRLIIDTGGEAALKDMSQDGTGAPICAAAQHNFLEGISMIVEVIGKDCLRQAYRGDHAVTPGHIAATNGHPAVLEMIAQLAGPEALAIPMGDRDDFHGGLLPIHFAAMANERDDNDTVGNAGHIQCIHTIARLLGPQIVHAIAGSNKTPAFYAAYNGKLDTLQSLVEISGDDEKLLREAATSAAGLGHVSILQYVASKLGATCFKSSNYYDDLTSVPPMYSAAFAGRVQALKYMATFGEADLHEPRDRKTRQSLAHRACINGHSLVLEFLGETCGVSILRHKNAAFQTSVYVQRLDGSQPEVGQRQFGETCLSQLQNAQGIVSEAMSAEMRALLRSDEPIKFEQTPQPACLTHLTKLLDVPDQLQLLVTAEQRLLFAKIVTTCTVPIAESAESAIPKYASYKLLWRVRAELEPLVARLKNKGNDLFRAGRYDTALGMYESALRECNYSNTSRAVLLSNSAQCQIKLQQWEAALSAANMALQLDPDSAKAKRRAELARTEVEKAAVAEEESSDAEYDEVHDEWDDTYGRLKLDYQLWVASALDQNFDKVQKLLLRGANIDSQQAQECSILGPERLQTPLKRGKTLQTPLHWAVRCGATDLIALLLKCGADPNIAEADTPDYPGAGGLTPLMLSLGQGRLGYVVDVVTREECSSLDICTLLLNHGANSRRQLVILLHHHPLPLAGVSIGMERGCQQNDSLANG